ncbi:MAG TPA: response regulator [Candidatus Paceibacterota bacterium]|nr:response regulator [Candidatus Paceibacterota bacterium]HPT18250.1 response regulator [Candidatus Paceibacterota bacterium]
MAKTVFIIEDDTFLQGLEATKLKKEGYDIQTAINADGVIDIIKRKVKIDLVLLDLMLPDVDGFEILKIIKKEQELVNVPVIIFSNLSEEKDIEKAKGLGINQFMVKSNFSLDELTAKVKELIGK